MIVIAVALLSSSLLYAQDKHVELPEALEQADARFYQAVQEAHAVRVRVYDRELQLAMRTGKLDLANAIKRRMDRFDVPTDGTKTYRVIVSATQNALAPVVVAQVKRGDRLGIRPVDGKWTGGGTRHGQYTDWTGYTPESPWMVLHARIGDRRYEIRQPVNLKAEADGDLVLYCEDRDPRGNDGQIAVVVTVTPAE
jgi:hypothetical protein